jgi:hypothetical protein
LWNNLNNIPAKYEILSPASQGKTTFCSGIMHRVLRKLVWNVDEAITKKASRKREAFFVV